VSSEVIEHACPSCGRSTTLTAYGPEPSLCVDCQRAFGLVAAGETREPEPVPAGHNPDDPVWGTLTALAVWVASIFALFAAQTGALLYLAYAGRNGIHIPPLEAHMTDPTLGLVLVLSGLLSHVITLLIVYFVVTDGGRLPFFSTIGWRWPEGLRLRHVFFIAVALYVFTIVTALVMSAPESTSFSRMINSSPWTKAAVGLLAIATAPLVEEIVYRGVLYPAFARRLGRGVSVVVVSALFTLVHVNQYDGALAIMIPLAMLSFSLTMLRAYTGTLLPSIALHLFFNSITVVLMYVGGGEAT
jgi:uncharacterized protein